jgi:hypothetical protein
MGHSKSFLDSTDLNSFKDKENADYLNKLSKTPDKKFYLSVDMIKINDDSMNNELLYPISAQTSFEPTWIPLINNISMMMPSKPVLFDWDSIPKVSFIFLHFFLLFIIL